MVQRFLSNKKAVIEIQASWIFILIAGVVILLFFTGITKFQRTSSEFGLEADVFNKFDLILSGLESSVKTSNVINLPKSGLIFECDKFKFSDSNIEGKSYKNAIVFGPDKLTSLKFITWTETWELPYKISNFLYIIDSGIKYLFIYDNLYYDKAFDLYENIPDFVNKEINLTPGLKQENTFYVFVTEQEPNFVQYNYSIWIKPLGDFHGEVNFPDGNQTHYLGDATLYGAIFSNNYKKYNCIIKKAFENYIYITDIFLKRTEYLINNVNEDCKQYYQTDHLRAILDETKNCNKNFPDLYNCDIERIKLNVNRLGGITGDNNLLQQWSCPLIY